MLETKKIGNKIAEARKKANISQAQLAERLFLSPQAVGKWERGESMPDITTFNRLAEILGVDLNYFSENFQSTSFALNPGKSLVNEKVELSEGIQNKRLSWNMSRGNWMDADFSGLTNLHEKFSSSNMQRCNFSGSDLSGLILKANNVDGCDFSATNISHSHIQGSNLLNNLFREGSIQGTDFSECNIARCDFTGANLKEAKFSKSYIYDCDFAGADLTGMVIRSGGLSGGKSKDLNKNTIADAAWYRTSIIDSQVTDIIFTGSLEDCYFENCKFTRVEFRNVTLINTFFKNNKNLKRIHFFDCMADRITCEFLKQGNADITGIKLITSNGETK
jgi:uncharacterized protein YjbI with pentapeptide repeats